MNDKELKELNKAYEDYFTTKNSASAYNKKIKKALDHINRFLAEREENKNRLPILLSDITNIKEILEE